MKLIVSLAFLIAASMNAYADPSGALKRDGRFDVSTASVQRDSDLLEKGICPTTTMTCPDGTKVYRDESNCKFPACPNTYRITNGHPTNSLPQNTLEKVEE